MQKSLSRFALYYIKANGNRRLLHTLFSVFCPLPSVLPHPLPPPRRVGGEVSFTGVAAVLGPPKREDQERKKGRSGKSAESLRIWRGRRGCQRSQITQAKYSAQKSNRKRLLLFCFRRKNFAAPAFSPMRIYPENFIEKAVLGFVHRLKIHSLDITALQVVMPVFCLQQFG